MLRTQAFEQKLVEFIIKVYGLYCFVLRPCILRDDRLSASAS